MDEADTDQTRGEAVGFVRDRFSHNNNIKPLRYLKKDSNLIRFAL